MQALPEESAISFNAINKLSPFVKYSKHNFDQKPHITHLNIGKAKVDTTCITIDITIADDVFHLRIYASD